MNSHQAVVQVDRALDESSAYYAQATLATAGMLMLPPQSSSATMSSGSSISPSGAQQVVVKPNNNNSSSNNKQLVKSGEMYMSTVSAGERERWRSRFFTLYTDGELICGLSSDPTVPILESLDLRQCQSINMSDDAFCLGFSNRTCYFRAANQVETKRWFLLLSEFFNNGPSAMMQRASKRVRLLLPAASLQIATSQQQQNQSVRPLSFCSSSSSPNNNGTDNNHVDNQQQNMGESQRVQIQQQQQNLIATQAALDSQFVQMMNNSSGGRANNNRNSGQLFQNQRNANAPPPQQQQQQQHLDNAQNPNSSGGSSNCLPMHPAPLGASSAQRLALQSNSSPRRSDSFTTAVSQQQQQQSNQNNADQQQQHATFTVSDQHQQLQQLQQQQDLNWIKKLQTNNSGTTAAALSLKNKQLLLQQQQQQQQQLKMQQPLVAPSSNAIRTVTVLKADWIMLKQQQQPQQQQQQLLRNPLAASSWSRCWLELSSSQQQPGSEPPVFKLTAYRGQDDRFVMEERCFGANYNPLQEQQQQQIREPPIRLLTGKAGQLYTITVEMLQPQQNRHNLIFATLSQNIANDWVTAIERCQLHNSVTQQQLHFLSADQNNTKKQAELFRKTVVDFLEPKPTANQPQPQQPPKKPINVMGAGSLKQHNMMNLHFREPSMTSPSNLLLASQAHLSSSEPSLLDRLGAPNISSMDRYFSPSRPTKQPSQPNLAGSGGSADLKQQQQYRQVEADVHATPKFNNNNNNRSQQQAVERAAYQLLESEVGSLKTRLELAAEEIGKLTEANSNLTKQMASLQRCQQESYSEIVKESQRYLEQIAEMHADMDAQSHFYEMQLQAANRSLQQSSYRLNFVLELVDILRIQQQQPQDVRLIEAKIGEVVKRFQDGHDDRNFNHQDVVAESADPKAWFAAIGQRFQQAVVAAIQASSAASSSSSSSSSLRLQNQQFEATVRRLESDNRSVRDEAATLSASVVELRDMIREKLAECDELSAQNYRLQAELERTQDALQAEIRKNSAKQSKFNRLEGAVEEQRERIRALETQAERSRFMSKKMEASLEARSHQISYLKRMLTHLHPTASSLDNSADATSASLHHFNSNKSLMSLNSSGADPTLAGDQGYLSLFLKYSAAIDQLERLKAERANMAMMTSTTNNNENDQLDGSSLLPPPPAVALQNQQQQQSSSTTPLMISNCLREMRTAVDKLQSGKSDANTVAEMSCCLARLSSVVTEQAEAFETIQQWCDTVRRRQKSLEDSYQARLGLLLERLAEQQHFLAAPAQNQPQQQLLPGPASTFRAVPSATLDPPLRSADSGDGGSLSKLISWLQLLVLQEMRSAEEQQQQQSPQLDDSMMMAATVSSPDVTRQRLLWQANRTLQLAATQFNNNSDDCVSSKIFLGSLVALLENCGLLPPETTLAAGLDYSTDHQPQTIDDQLNAVLFNNKQSSVAPCRQLKQGENCFAVVLAFLNSTKQNVSPGLRPFVDALAQHCRQQQQQQQQHDCQLQVSAENTSAGNYHPVPRQQSTTTTTTTTARPQAVLHVPIRQQQARQQATLSSSATLPPASTTNTNNQNNNKRIVTNSLLMQKHQACPVQPVVMVASSSSSMSTMALTSPPAAMSERTLLGISAKQHKSQLKTRWPSVATALAESQQSQTDDMADDDDDDDDVDDDDTVHSIIIASTTTTKANNHNNNNKGSPQSSFASPSPSLDSNTSSVAGATGHCNNVNNSKMQHQQSTGGGGRLFQKNPRLIGNNHRQQQQQQQQPSSSSFLSGSCEYLHARAEVFDI